jgi:hypothetical protein
MNRSSKIAAFVEQTLAESIQARKKGDGRRGGEALLGLGV